MHIQLYIYILYLCIIWAFELYIFTLLVIKPIEGLCLRLHPMLIPLDDDDHDDDDDDDDDGCKWMV